MSIETDALALPPEQRARLAEKLWESLDPEGACALPDDWMNEVARRRKEITQGKVKPVGGEEVSRKAWGLVKPPGS